MQDNAVRWIKFCQEDTLARPLRLRCRAPGRTANFAARSSAHAPQAREPTKFRKQKGTKRAYKALSAHAKPRFP